MKKISIIFTVITLLFATLLIDNVLAQNEIRLYIGGERYHFDQPPVIVNGRTLVPVRAVSEALEARVIWDEQARTATVEKDSTSITLYAGNETAIVNSNLVFLEVPAQIMNGRIMVPLRFISEELGLTVIWEPNINSILLFEEATAPGGGATPSPGLDETGSMVFLMKDRYTVADTNLYDQNRVWVLTNQPGVVYLAPVGHYTRYWELDDAEYHRRVTVTSANTPYEISVPQASGVYELYLVDDNGHVIDLSTHKVVQLWASGTLMKSETEVAYQPLVDPEVVWLKANRTGYAYLAPYGNYREREELEEVVPLVRVQITQPDRAVSVTPPKKQGYYYLYVVDQDGYVSSAASYYVYIQGPTATLMRNITTAATTHLFDTQRIWVKSNRVGDAYLVPAGEYANRSDLEGATNKIRVPITSVDVPVEIETPNVAGRYQVYVVDEDGVISQSARYHVEIARPVATLMASSSSEAKADLENPSMVLAKSNKRGHLYLAPPAEYSKKADLETAAGNSRVAVTNVNIPIPVPMPAKPGVYGLYAVDEEDNISEAAKYRVLVNVPEVTLMATNSTPATTNLVNYPTVWVKSSHTGVAYLAPQGIYTNQDALELVVEQANATKATIANAALPVPITVPAVPGVYKLYVVDGNNVVSKAAIYHVVVEGPKAVLMRDIFTEATGNLTDRNQIWVLTDRPGYAYLVREGNYSGKEELDAADELDHAPNLTRLRIEAADVNKPVRFQNLPVKPGTYRLYVVDDSGVNVSVADYRVIVSEPVATLMSTDEKEATNHLNNPTKVWVKSNRTGFAYLVPEGSYADKAALDAIVAEMPKAVAKVSLPGSVNTPVAIDVPKAPGTYKLYVVDGSDRVAVAKYHVVVPKLQATLMSSSGSAASSHRENPNRVWARSNRGDVWAFLAPSGNYTSKAQLEAAAGTGPVYIEKPNTSVEIPVPSAARTYRLYLVDDQDHVSPPATYNVIIK